MRIEMVVLRFSEVESRDYWLQVPGQAEERVLQQQAERRRDRDFPTMELGQLALDPIQSPTNPT